MQFFQCKLKLMIELNL